MAAAALKNPDSSRSPVRLTRPGRALVATVVLGMCMCAGSGFLGSGAWYRQPLAYTILPAGETTLSYVNPVDQHGFREHDVRMPLEMVGRELETLLRERQLTWVRIDSSLTSDGREVNGHDTINNLPQPALEWLHARSVRYCLVLYDLMFDQRQSVGTSGLSARIVKQGTLRCSVIDVARNCRCGYVTVSVRQTGARLGLISDLVERLIDGVVALDPPAAECH